MSTVQYFVKFNLREIQRAEGAAQGGQGMCLGCVWDVCSGLDRDSSMEPNLANGGDGSDGDCDYEEDDQVLARPRHLRVHQAD